MTSLNCVGVVVKSGEPARARVDVMSPSERHQMKLKRIMSEARLTRFVIPQSSLTADQTNYC